MKDSITVTDWTRLALRRDILSRSTRVGLVVGTLLAAINHGDKIVSTGLDVDSLLKILLTYLVPYCVSTWASVQAARAAAN